MIRPGTDRAEHSHAGVVELGAADVPEMLDLTARTRPGPFWRRTHELGTYLGVRLDGRLVAMAGNGSGLPAGPRSAPSARRPRPADRATPPAW